MKRQGPWQTRKAVRGGKPLQRPVFSLQVTGGICALGKPLQRAYIPFGLRHHERQVVLHDDQLFVATLHAHRLTGFLGITIWFILLSR